MNDLPSTLKKKLINRNTPLPDNSPPFNKGNSYNLDSSLNRRALVIGQGIHIQGTFNNIETLVIEGTIETSTIKLKKLIIQQSGVFHGTVESQDVEITGLLEGDITVQGNLTVTSNGRLVGKAKCRRLKVEDGGQITGQVEMITTEKLKQSPSLSDQPKEKTSSDGSSAIH